MILATSLAEYRRVLAELAAQVSPRILRAPGRLERAARELDETVESAELFLYPGDQPGLGVDLDEDAAAGHDYTKAYLPVNRLLDGTLHDW